MNLPATRPCLGQKHCGLSPAFGNRPSRKSSEFTRLRDEAKLLADSGKKSEALEKFEAAFFVIPDSDVGQQILQLRQDLSKVQ